MIKTFGLTHIALPVKDAKRSSAFYQEIFGVKEMYRYPDFIQVQTPGSKDILSLKRRQRKLLLRKNIFISDSGCRNLPISSQLLKE